MRGQKTQIGQKRAAYLTAALTTLCLSTASFAETQVRLESNSESATFSEGYKLSVEDWSAQTRLSRSRTDSQFKHHSQERPQVWISDIGTSLFDDFDGDGYHSGFSITIDVDSDYGDTEVYAKIYLQSTFDQAALLHQTSRFAVYGTTTGDEYRIDTEFRNNFALDDYDVMVDIHDAWSDQLLDTANARGFPNLGSLPLESGEQNQPPQYLEGDSDENINDDVVITEYAGASHPLALLALFGGWLARRRFSQS